MWAFSNESALNPHASVKIYKFLKFWTTLWELGLQKPIFAGNVSFLNYCNALLISIDLIIDKFFLYCSSNQRLPTWYF